MSRTTSGTMLAQLFGGGTANMEFEALSGLSLSQFLPQMNTPYQMLVTDTPTFPSAVGYFKDHGHEPVAVHPYMTSMYKRYAVYPTLGFDRFVHDTTMQQADRIDRNDFISDKSAFDEVEHQIATSDKPALVNLITMQNHYPMADKYDDPIPVGGVTGETKDEFSNYARGLKHSDDALRDFITDLKSSGEKTAVIFYGDHEPAFWDRATYDRNGDTRMRETPFFIWTNFKALPHGTTPPLTSPIYFLPTLFDEVGASLPPYYVLLNELHAQIPAMEQGEYFLPDGRKVSYSGLPPRAKAILHDYRLVQYDLAVGDRYSQARMFYADPSR
jgi:phosphoglycerol transferase MdoB-like AlkP superfamily enzyme